LQDLLTPEQNIIFWEMFQSQKIEWLRAEFKKNKLYIEDDAINFILDMIENNKEQLKNEIYKISALFKENESKNNVIKKSFIEKHINHSKLESPFTLYSAMLEGNLSKSMEILETLFLSDEYSLLNGLVWSHRRFLKALDLYENQKLPIQEVFTNLKITNKSNKEDFEKGFQRYNFYHSSLMFNYLSELDYYLKVFPRNLKLIKLEEFLINFINGDIKKTFLQGELEYLHC
jgi:DNA polymerase-3 subunit delta